MELMRRPLPMKHKTTEKSGWKVLLKTDKAWNRKRMERMRRWLPMKHKSTEKSGRKLLLKTDRTRNRKRMEWTRHHLFMKTELAMRPDLRPPPPWIVAAVRCAMRRATLATRSLRSTLLRMPGSTWRTPPLQAKMGDSLPSETVSPPKTKALAVQAPLLSLLRENIAPPKKKALTVQTPLMSRTT